MLIIHPDGRFEEKLYVDYKSICAGVNTPETDDPFTTVPLPEGVSAGYTVFANDNGLITGLPRNQFAEALCDYGPLVGPVVVASFEEAKEEDLISTIDSDARASFLDRVERIKAAAGLLATRAASRMN